MSSSSSSKQLESIHPFGASVYEPIDLTGLVAFTVNWLLDRSIPTTFENIVVAAFRMFPRKFCLEGFSEYPDAARIGRTLLQLGPKYRNWARGSVQKGFVLTQSGAAKVAKVTGELLGEQLNTSSASQRGSASPRTMDLGREFEPIERSVLFREWQAGRIDEQRTMELFDVLGAYAYTPRRALRDRLAVLENAASQIGRSDLIEFFRALRKAFASHLREE